MPSPRLTPSARLTPHLNSNNTRVPRRLPLRSGTNLALPTLRNSSKNILIICAAAIASWLFVIATACGIVLLCAALLACV